MRVRMLTFFVLCLSFSAMASEFRHIRLHPEFEDYLNRPEMKSSPGAKSVQGGQAFYGGLGEKIREVLLGFNGNFAPASQVEGEESLLYEEIRRHLEAAHEEIGKGQVAQIDRLNRQFNLGTENFSGFSWQKPFGVVGVNVDRQVTPNLFGSNWLVQDTFAFEIEATTFLEKLSESGLAPMTSAEIGAFAGITFKRVYTYYHYADSYRAGLMADFSKLFLQFTRFNLRGVEKMKDEEIMKRQDNWTARIGGLISTPPLYNISFSGGVLAEYAYQQQVSVQSHFGKAHTDERLRLGLKSNKVVSVGATLGLQLDFFRLIQLSLLRYDLTYEYAAGKEFTLGMNNDQFRHVLASPKQGSELRSILRGRPSIKYLEPYVIRLDESSSSSLNSNGSILLWGRINKSKTEQIRVIKDEGVRIFFKNYSLSVRVVQNFFNRLFSAVVYKVFKLPVGIKNAAMYNRQITMEYEATHPQATDPKVNRIEKTEQFSFVLTQSYEAARTHRWIDLKFKNDVIWFIDAFTSLSPEYKTNVRRSLLRGPLKVESNLRIGKEGLDFLLARPVNDVFTELVRICGSELHREWTNEKQRERLLRSVTTEEDACVRSLGRKFMAFKQDYLAHHLQPSLVHFKSFLTGYYKQAEHLGSLTALFGPANTFLHGKLSAQTAQGNDFSTSFSSGQFHGLGVIDNFKRASGTRQPASIVSED
jgi:hypothetical protein